MILFKQLVAADTKYPFPNQSNCVVFDVNNDTPFNMGVSFGKDTGPDNADYFTTPHSVLTGIGPKGNAPSLNNSRWNGTIYIYTETPLGTGATNLSSAPAFQITMIGYPAGYQPTGTTSLARMTSTPNAVSTVSGGSNFVQDDQRTPGALTLEATPAGAGASDATISNQGVGFMAGAWRFLSTVEVDAGIQANLITALTGNDIGFHVASGQHVKDTVNGVDIFSVGSSGPILLAGTLSFLVGSISRISIFTAGVTTTPTFFNHGLGVVPDLVIGVPNGTNPGPFSVQVDFATLTTTQCKLAGNSTFPAVCLAIKL